MFNQSASLSYELAVYETPDLIEIGSVVEVVLGVSGGGDDFMGFSRPEMEFELDSVNTPDYPVQLELK